MSLGLVVCLGSSAAATMPVEGNDFKVKFGAVHFIRPLSDCVDEFLDVKIEEWVFHVLGPNSTSPHGSWGGRSVFASALWWRTDHCTGIEETYAQGSIDSSTPLLSFSLGDNLGDVAFATSIEMFDGLTGESVGTLSVDLYLDQVGGRYPITIFNGDPGDPHDKQTGLATGAEVGGTVSGFASFEMDEVYLAEIGRYSSLLFPNP